MSTADSYLLAGTTLVTNNVLLKVWPIQNELHKLRLLRAVSTVMALIALALAFSGQSIFDMMVHSGTTLFVSIFVPATAALFYKRACVQSAWASMIGGTVAWLGFLLYSKTQGIELSEDILFAAAAFGAIASFIFYAITSCYLELTCKSRTYESHV